MKAKRGDVRKTPPVSAPRRTPQRLKKSAAFFMSRHQKERKAISVFRVEGYKGYMVMSNHHLRNKGLSLKAKGLLSQILSLPENWDYTLKDLTLINWEQIDPEKLDGIVELLVETVCTARKTIRVAGDDYPAELVKANLLKLNNSGIEFVLDCMRESATKILNIKKYLLAALFTPPAPWEATIPPSPPTIWRKGKYKWRLISSRHHTE